ncbi:MAG TPA: FecR domain-containing protein [Ohtaekwangia sp.]|nr:FecR domain-containing protein [Ohtaekwangia sp.]
MNEFEFDRLIELYQKNLLTGREKKLVEDWLNKPGSDEDTSFRSSDKLALKHKILSAIDPVESPVITLDSSSEKRGRVSYGRGFILKIAASVALVALLAYVITQNEFIPDEKVAMVQATSSGAIHKVILPDGTLVWLKGSSTLTYPSAFLQETRNVSLHGEALFEVTKDAQHPFIISCGDLTTTVLGTSFNIKSINEQIEVVVLTGKVALTSLRNNQEVIVLPNEKVIYDGNKKELTAKQAVTEEKLATVSGTNYLMAFEDSRMSEVIQRIEEKFEARISVSDPKLKNCLITADFSDQSLESTLSMISQALNFTYSMNGRSVTLSGKGCD